MKSTVRKIASVLLSALLLLGLLPAIGMTSFAAGAAVSVSFGEYEDGAGFPLVVEITGASGLNAVTLTVAYDAADITPVTPGGGEYPTGDENATAVYNVKADSVKFSYYNVNACTQDTLTLGRPLFTISDDTLAGELTEVTVTVAAFMAGSAAYTPAQNAALGFTKGISVHHYPEPDVVFSDDNASCTATRVCGDEVCGHHVQTETVNTTSEITKAPTCSAMGETTYTAVFAEPDFGTRTNTVTNVDIAPDAHSWGEWVGADDDYHTHTCVYDASHTGSEEHTYGAAVYTWAADGSACTAVRTCQVCNYTQTAAAVITSKVTTEATCGTTGVTTYTATFASAGLEEQTKSLHDIPNNPDAHVWKETYLNAGYHTAACAFCGLRVGGNQRFPHAFTIEKVLVPATCVAEGTKTYECVCGYQSSQTETIPVDPDAHSWTLTSSQAPTCAAVGYENYTCSLCGATKTDDIPKLTVHTWDDGVIDPSTGIKTFTCAVCGATRTEEVYAQISAQPADVEAAVGETATFTVAAEGAAVAYRWQYSVDGGETWSDTAFEGSSSAALNVPVTAELDGSIYRCVITDVLNTVTTETAQLTVLAAISAQPESVSAGLDETVSFTVAAAGIAPVYQWQYSGDGGETWTDCDAEGFDTDTLTVDVTAELEGHLFRCVVSDTNNTVISDEAALTVIAVITDQPFDYSTIVDLVASFNIEATGLDPHYQWQQSVDNGATWTDSEFSGADTDFLYVPVTVGRNGMMFRCVLTDVNNTVISEPAALKVLAFITAQPQSYTGYVGDTAQFSVDVTGVSPTYQWQHSYNGGETWKNSGFTGNKTAIMNVPVTAARNGFLYRCVITDVNNVVTSEPAELTVFADIASQPESVVSPIGGNAYFTVGVNAVSPSYQWQTSVNGGQTWKNSGFTGNKTETLTVAVSEARDGYLYRCVVTDVNNTVTSDAAELKVGAGITSQPTSVETVLGTTAVFSVEATGLDVHYQWQQSSNSGKTWAKSGFSTATQPDLKVPVIATRDGYMYRCVVTDTNNTVTSDAATLIVLAQITEQPENAAIESGQTAEFSVGVSALSPAYQWQYSEDDGNTWTNSSVDTAKNATLSVPVTAEMNGYQFRCVVTDTNNTVTSDPAGLTAFAVILSQPESVELEIGKTATFTVVVDAVEPTYQWQYSANGGTTWTNSNSALAKTASYKAPVTASHDGWLYRCIVKDLYSTVYSDVAKLTSLSVIKSQPRSVNLEIGQTAEFSVIVSGFAPAYQWQTSSNGGKSWSNSSFSTAKTATLSVPVTAARNSYQYRCVVTDKNNVVISSAAELSALALISAQPESAAVDIGQNATFTVGVNGIAPSYQWQVSSNGGSSWKASGFSTAKKSTLSVPVTAARNGMQFRCVVTDKNNSIVSDVVELSALSVITSQPESAAVDIGQTASFTVGVNGVAPSYQWQVSSNEGSTWKNSGFSTAKTATLSVPVTAARNGQHFRCIVSDKNNVLVTDTVELMSLAVITSQPKSSAVEVGQTATFKVNVSGVDPTYQWQVSSNGGATWKNSGFSTAKTATLSVPVTSARNGQQFRCIVTDINSIVISESAELTSISGISVQPKSGTFEVGQIATFTVSVIASEPSYQWQLSADGGLTWKNSGFSTAKSATLSVPVTAARNGQQFRCIISDGSNTFTSDVVTLTVVS